MIGPPSSFKPSREALIVSDLRVVTSYGAEDVIDEVSFEVAAGQTLGLVGESGSGKTTVALALLAHARRGLRIAGGRVVVNGTDLLALSRTEVRAWRGRSVAYVPQDPGSALNPGLKVGTQLREVLHRVNDPGVSPAARIAGLLEEVNLPADRILDSYPHQLSGGQQQRVVLAMGFARRPAVIVLDEPTTGLDVSTQRRVLETIRTLCSNHGVAGVFVSHDLAVIGELVDRVAVMYAGRIVELGDTKEVFARPAHPYTRALMRAVPAVEDPRVLRGLPGSPPRPGQRPAGCAFAPRCEFVEARCNRELPGLLYPAESHMARCLRAAEIARADADARGARLEPRARATNALLRVTGLNARYGSRPTLDGISLELRAGECLAIVGESGSGKTTLARCLAGLHQNWSGRIVLRERELARAARQRSRAELGAIQYVFQNPYASLNPRRTIGQILEQAARQFFRLSRQEASQRVGAALERAALSANFRSRYPGELSGGERQRAAIARALIVEPDVLICDEVTSALDVSVQAAIVETLRHLQADDTLALVFITHNLALVRAIAQRILVLRDGVIVEAGDSTRVLEAPGADYTRTLLADLPRPPSALPASGPMPIQPGEVYRSESAHAAALEQA